MGIGETENTSAEVQGRMVIEQCWKLGQRSGNPKRGGFIADKWSACMLIEACHLVGGLLAESVGVIFVRKAVLFYCH